MVRLNRMWYEQMNRMWYEQRSVGRRVKTHKITPAVGNERGDIEIGKYILLPRGQDNLLPPRPILLDYTRPTTGLDVLIST